MKKKNFLIINGHQRYDGIAEGGLTNEYIKVANEFLTNNDFEVKSTIINAGYDIKEEVDKWDWADYILFQYPVYTMSLPWLAKKYMDEVTMSGRGIIYTNDGRSADDLSKKYGSGGLMKDKKYMLSMTYNCPSSEFNNKDGFFEGVSVDGANIAVHKIFQFCGLEKTQTYSVHDIFNGKLNLQAELEKFTSIIKKNFLIVN